MSRKNALTQEGLDNLLRWLSKNRDEAAAKYERIRLSLIKKFTWSQCSEPEALADEVFNIVARKLPALAKDYKGPPERYFHGVARNLILKKEPSHQIIEISENLKDERDPEAEAEKAMIERCQRKCLSELEPGQRTLIIDYYRNGSLQNPEFRKDLANKYRIEPGKLRVDIHRIRKLLADCFDRCINNSRIGRARSG
jgi:DNA-directed RNA polymerase specialized sigma24 family protein